ncbi:MAG: AEC family transporter [Lachnospiraceae bacterium]|nr:AEC family transporter [Lachnospiraceae bacterium]
MFETFTATLSTMMVVMVCIAAGYAAGKAKIMPADSDSVLSRCETYIFCPAMVINSLMVNCTLDALKSSARPILYCFGIMVLAFLIGIPIVSRLEPRGYQRNILKYAIIFPNFGFLGLAIVPLIMGQDALFGYVMFILPLNFGVYTYGTSLLIKDESGKKGFFRRLVNPMFISTFLGVILGVTGIGPKLPTFLKTGITYLSNCFSPVAMVLSGIVVSRFGLKMLFTVPKSYIMTFLRLIALPVIFLTLLRFLGAERDVMLYTLLAFGAPLGLNTIVFPASCGEDTSSGASMAMVSHILCILTIPLLYAAMVGLSWV